MHELRFWGYKHGKSILSSHLISCNVIVQIFIFYVYMTTLIRENRIHSHTHPPPPEFVAALKNFKASQGTSEAKLKDREALAKRALDLYGKAGEKGMRDLARRKEVLLGEISRMEDEIVNLEQGG